MMNVSKAQMAKTIDHTLLKATATKEQITKLCEEAKKFNFASVCINSSYVPLCAKLLKGSGVEVCTVIGFPLGACTTATKVFETKDAVQKGADEVDMVINVGLLKSGDFDAVYEDIKAVVDAASGKTTKVIIETCYLTDEEKRKACELAKKAGATFVKTSTGFGTGGATVEDVKLMRSVVGKEMKVKASGGIRSTEDAIKMLEAGADRLGTSAGIAIMEGMDS